MARKNSTFVVVSGDEGGWDVLDHDRQPFAHCATEAIARFVADALNLRRDVYYKLLEKDEFYFIGEAY